MTAATTNTVASARVGLVGVGKMGVSHLAIGSAQPNLAFAAACDSQGFILAGLRSQLDIETYKSFETMLSDANLNAIMVATPTSSHVDIAEKAIRNGLHLFVEKPLTLSAADSRRLAALAAEHGVVNQVGYHNRFIGTFREVARLVAAGAIGDVHQVDGSAFGQVVTKRQGGGQTWRSKKSEGGGCLHDYACHVIDLMNFIVGPPQEVVAAQLSKIYSTAVEDAVHAMFRYPNGALGTLQTNWSDPSYRKMTTSITVHGSKGKIQADRQECRLFLHPGQQFEEFEEGWTIRYITELQDPVEFYLRGEEYSAQMDAFAAAIAGQPYAGACTFADAADADWVVSEIERVHRAETPTPSASPTASNDGAGNNFQTQVRHYASRAAREISRLSKDAIDRVKEARR